jgi:hypothetical protein
LAHVLVRRGTSDSDGDGRTGPPGRVGTSEAHASPRLLCDAFRLGATRATQVALGRWFIITRLFFLNKKMFRRGRVRCAWAETGERVWAPARWAMWRRKRRTDEAAQQLRQKQQQQQQRVNCRDPGPGARRTHLRRRRCCCFPASEREQQEPLAASALLPCSSSVPSGSCRQHERPVSVRPG